MMRFRRYRLITGHNMTIEHDVVDGMMSFIDPEEEELPRLPAVCTLATVEHESSPISVEEFVREQATDMYCQRMTQQVGTSGSDFTIDREGMLVRKSPLDGAL